MSTEGHETPSGDGTFPREETSKPLIAARDDPDVSAFTVAESVFCRRAGLISHESPLSDSGDDWPALGLRPWYELQALEEAWQRLFLACCGWLAVFVVCTFVTTRLHGLMSLAGLAGMLATTRQGFRTFRRLNALTRIRLAAHRAPVCEPDPEKGLAEPVNWWGLLRAGFDSTHCPKAYADKAARLSGKPKRILRKGNLAIPVFRTKSAHERPKPQHQVRVIIYCHLLEKCEGAWSPYGVVLLGDSHQGFTVPNTNGHRERFQVALENVRRVIRGCQREQLEPAPPQNTDVCSGCPYGKPRRVRDGQPTICNGQALRPYVLVGKLREQFHCDCGDRFQWRPLHYENEGLRPL